MTSRLFFNDLEGDIVVVVEVVVVVVVEVVVVVVVVVVELTIMTFGASRQT